MQISRVLGHLALLSLPWASARAQQPAPCPMDRACYYATQSLSSRRIVEPKGFQVWAVDSNTYTKSGWFTVAIRGGYRKFIRVEDKHNFDFQTGVAPDMERVGSAGGVPIRKDSPAPRYVPPPKTDTVRITKTDTVPKYIEVPAALDTTPKPATNTGCRGSTFSCHPVAWGVGAAVVTAAAVTCAIICFKHVEAHSSSTSSSASSSASRSGIIASPISGSRGWLVGFRLTP